MERKRKLNYWLIPMVILIILLLFAIVFWDTLLVYLAPKMVLSTAMSNTGAALQDRFSGSPVLVLENALDSQGRNTIQMELNTTKKPVGDIKYDLTLQTACKPKQFFAEGSVTAGEKEIDIAMYLDQDFAALTSQSLLKGNFYGITYDTFSQDVRNHTILNFLFDEETLRDWENTVSELQTKMEGTVEIPDISQKDLKMLFAGILTLRADVRKETIVLSRGSTECFAIRFYTTGNEIQQAMDYAQIERSLPIAEDDSIVVDFYLLDNHVVKCTAELVGTQKEYAVSIMTDQKPETDAIDLRFLSNKAGRLESFHAKIRTISNEMEYSEEVEISYAVNGVSNDGTCAYAWNRSDGSLQLSLVENGAKTSLNMILTEQADGFGLQTDDFDALLTAITKEEHKGNSTCTMVVSKGSDFETPTYKNFDQWSTDDLIILFGSIGSLFGLNLE